VIFLRDRHLLHQQCPVDVVLAGAFGLLGYWLIKHDFEPAPLLLGMVLGPLMEENLRRALLISRGDWTVFLTRPLSAVLMATAAFLLVLALLPSLRKKRDDGVRGVGNLTCVQSRSRPGFGICGMRYPPGRRGETGGRGRGAERRFCPCRLWTGWSFFRV